ncbi:2-hydroxyacid dehydrogenase [Rhizobium sp. L1K21]|uniref:2-hydroxyacid dehydrogenase n=1 Tax=Rhizobium sp. L1K21 TaxID=2954933 RepID=UPI0020922517|nr:2-hydroxyacid dehydrogenase [Rhizobium sp. L1K21]MCO6185017.1 2-hydroxyacid dehydrogenase [Rhizobium sp. L1K21]
MTKTTILIAGKLHPRVLQRIGTAFEIVQIEKPDAALVDPQLLPKIKAVSSFVGVPASLIDALPNLEIIANFGVGYDGVDVKRAAERGIIVTNTPDVLNDEVADTTVGLLLNTLRRLPQAESWLRDGRWAREGNFPLSPLSLRGRTIGIYGLGRIGLEIARRLEAFGVPISYHTRTPRRDVSYTYYPDLRSLAEGTDTLICIVPKTPETHKTINAKILAQLGPTGVLINVGRGWTVDEDDLADALEKGVIAAAGLDVFQDEPRVPERLLKLDNACLLPHVASASVPTRNAMADLVADNLLNWFEKGEPLTPVPETPFERANS